MVKLILIKVILFVLLFSVDCEKKDHDGPPHDHPQNMEQLCAQYANHLNHQHIGHMREMKYRSCSVKIRAKKFEEQETICLEKFNPRNIGVCMHPEEYQKQYTEMKKCLKERMMNPEEMKKIQECMGIDKPKEGRPKRSVWSLMKTDNLAEFCSKVLHQYYAHHPSHHEAWHKCTLEVIGKERVDKRAGCYNLHPIKSMDDFVKKCKTPKEFEAEFAAEHICFEENRISEDERHTIMNCTLEGLRKLDDEWKAKVWKHAGSPNFSHLCVKGTSYWNDEDKLYKNRFESCAMKVNSTKLMEQVACESFDQYDQSVLEKCLDLDKFSEEYSQSIACLRANAFTEKEEKEIQQCMQDSRVAWKGVPPIYEAIAEFCAHAMVRWFKYNPVFYEYLDGCMKEKLTEEELTKFECRSVFNIESIEHFKSSCKEVALGSDVGKKIEASYGNYIKCRSENAPPMEKITNFMGCGLVKMVNHYKETKAEGDEDSSADDDQMNP